MSDHVARRSADAEAVIDERTRRPRLRYRLAQPPPLVSLLIPTRDRSDLLETCIRSIRTRTHYDPIEIIIIDNDSREEATHRLFAALRKERGVRILSLSGPFNFSALNNLAAGEAQGSVLALVNNDIEVRDGGWLGK